MIIVFSGVDCSGKSTQISLLSKFLDGLGMSNLTLWCRGGYSPGFLILKSVIRFVARGRLPPSGRTPARSNTLRNPLIANLWLFISIFDLILFWSVYLRLLDFLGFVVICDRYIDDTRIDFALNFPESNFDKSLVWRFLEFSVPRPQASFLLVVPPNISLERSLLKNEPFPDSLHTLESRYSYYSNIPSSSSFYYHKLECLSTPNDIFALVMDKLSSAHPVFRVFN